MLLTHLKSRILELDPKCDCSNLTEEQAISKLDTVMRNKNRPVLPIKPLVSDRERGRTLSGWSGDGEDPNNLGEIPTA